MATLVTRLTSSTFFINGTLDEVTYAGTPGLTERITTSTYYVGTQFDEYTIGATYYGGSIYFEGTTSYLTWSPGSTVAFGTNNFTVEAWINLTQAQNSQYVIDTRNTGQTTGWSFEFGPTTPGEFTWYNGSTLILQDPSSTDISTSTWQHVAYVRNGTQGTLYRNGISVISAPDSTNYSVASTLAYIGSRYSPAAGDYMTGNITNLRIVNGQAVYTGNFIPPVGALQPISGTVLLLNSVSPSTYLKDSGPANFTLTAVGTPTYSTSTNVFFTYPAKRVGTGGNVFTYGILDEVTGIS